MVSLGGSRTLKVKKKEGQQTNNVTFMILVICVIYLVGNILDLFGFFLGNFEPNFYKYQFGFLIATNLLLFTSHGVYFFIYYNFNGTFRKTFSKVKKKIMSLDCIAI